MRQGAGTVRPVTDLSVDILCLKGCLDVTHGPAQQLTRVVPADTAQSHGIAVHGDDDGAMQLDAQGLMLLAANAVRADGHELDVGQVHHAWHSVDIYLKHNETAAVSNANAKANAAQQTKTNRRL